MINNPIVFNQEQLDIIAGIKAKVNFNSESWMCDEVEILRPIIRQYYAIEQNSTCPYCKMQLNTQRGRTWDVEHIIPRSAVENFMFEPLNLCVAQKREKDILRKDLLLYTLIHYRGWKTTTVILNTRH
ncbi:HNH endonuclease [Yersinia kristensenii]|uniref:HNH endonuclease n=1 Tax=Yersinia kristensenii TaxID=28152 RepID=UPI0005E0BAF2|nr:hypothetical protein [Yersinia kristensenii]CNG42082.1 Uncharacterised protein [Yersinia kristensenii]CNJ91991.1 Uncharacterised protein [Yersinia kristensenii]